MVARRYGAHQPLDRLPKIDYWPIKKASFTKNKKFNPKKYVALAEKVKKKARQQIDQASWSRTVGRKCSTHKKGEQLLEAMYRLHRFK